jgi:hypothetical protein
MRLIALKDLSLVADDTGIVSKIQMMLYIAGYKSRFIECSVSSNLWFIICKSTHPQNLLSLVILSDRHRTIYQLFQVSCLEDLQG